jgi:cytochrome c peroxidase
MWGELPSAETLSGIIAITPRGNAVTRFRESMGVVLTGVLVLGVAIALPLLPGFSESGMVATMGVSYQLPQLQGLKDTHTFVPADNPLTAEKVERGRLLFFDKRLSQNNTIACASCHMSEKGFTDGMPVSIGIYNRNGRRSALALINRVYSKAQFWDGWAETLEDQSIGPFVDPVEHGFINHEEMVAKMRQIPGYWKLFQDARWISLTVVGRRTR